MNRIAPAAVFTSLMLGAVAAAAQGTLPSAYDIAVAQDACEERGIYSAEFEDETRRKIIVRCNKGEGLAVNGTGAAAVGLLLLLGAAAGGGGGSAGGGSAGSVGGGEVTTGTN